MDAGAVDDGEDAGAENADGGGDPDGGEAGGAVGAGDVGEDGGAENAVDAGGVAGAEGAGSTGGADVQPDCRHGLSPPPGEPPDAPAAGRSPLGAGSSAPDSGCGAPR